MANKIVTIVAMGSRGDVQPYVALSKGLQAAGFHVRLATSSSFRPFIAEHGIEFFEVLDIDIEAMMQQDEIKSILEVKNPLKMLRSMTSIMQERYLEALHNIGIALEGAACAVLNPLTIFGAFDICEKHNIPAVFGYLQPTVPTREHRSAMFPEAPSEIGERTYNWFSHHIALQAYWQLMRPLVNKYRRNELGVEPWPVYGAWAEMVERKLPFAMGFSPHVVPAAKDWPEGVEATGYWFLDAKSEWQPPTI